MKKLFFYLFIAVIFMACQSKKNIETDVDGLRYWMNNYTITDEYARSGKFSSKMDSLQPYSVGYFIPLNHIENPQGKTVTFSAWVYYTQKPIKTGIVVSILGNKTLWDFKDVVTSNSTSNNWYQVSISTKLPHDIDINDELRTYITSGEKNDVVYVDDLSLEIK